MPPSELPLSEYRAVWLFAMFDLPVDTSADRRAYARFRKLLLSLGFSMLQYSVYARYFPSEEASTACRNQVKAGLPEHGQVRLLAVTDRQFGKMQVFYGKKRRPAEEPPAQLLLF